MTIPKDRLISSAQLFYPETSAAPASSFRGVRGEKVSLQQFRRLEMGD
jgi:hypothetical protein